MAASRGVQCSLSVQTPPEVIELKEAIQNLQREAFAMAREQENKVAERRKKRKQPKAQPPETTTVVEKGCNVPRPKRSIRSTICWYKPKRRGRARYLNSRNKLSPDKRFYSTVTSSQEYGWKVVEKGARPMKEHCRVSIIRPSFYRRYGAIKPESPLKRPPFPSGYITFDFV